MAGVNTSLGIQDRVTSRIKKITAAWDRMTSAAQRADQATEQVDPGRNFERGASLIDRARQRLDDFLRKQREVGEGAGQVEHAWDRIGVAAKAALAMFSVQKIKQALTGFLDLFNQQYRYEVQLATVMGNNGSTQAEVQRIIDTAAALQGKTTYGDEALIAGAAELSTYIGSTDAIEAMMGTLTNYAAGMGGIDVGPEQMVEYATQLGKALDGTLDGLRKKGFDMTEAQKQIIETGTEMERVAVITDIINDSWENLAENLARTPEGAITRFKNAMGDWGETIGSRVVTAVLELFDTIEAFMSSDTMVAITEGIVFALNAIVTGISWVISGVGRLGAFVQQHWNVIQPILMAIALVMLPLMLAQLWGMIAPILTQAAAWAVAHANMILIIAVIAGIVALMIDMGVTFEDVCGFIGGLLGGLYAIGYNLIADMWNIIAVFAEFFANVFNDPVGAIVRLFVGLADSVLGILETLAGAIDWVFGSNLADAVGGWRDSVQAWADEVVGPAQVTIDRMDKLDTTATSTAWAEGGRDFANGVADLLDNLSGNPYESALSLNGAMSVGDVDYVGELGSINEDVNIAEEDLKFLKDYAEMKYVQNFVTLTPTIAVDATITEKVDLDEFTGKLEGVLMEEIAIEAEKVFK